MIPVTFPAAETDATEGTADFHVIGMVSGDPLRFTSAVS
jgi:hypothetical protein